MIPMWASKVVVGQNTNTDLARPLSVALIRASASVTLPESALVLIDVSQGTGEDFCSVPANCQRDFGTCDSNMVPTGFNTSSMGTRDLDGALEYATFISACSRPRSIALTYDDGPTNNTEELLDLLMEAGAKATFFVAGNINGRGAIDETSQWTEVIKRMEEDGHQIASHSWSHSNLDTITSEARTTEIVKNERAIANILGKYPTYMRPPFLQCDETMGCLDDMRHLGYHLISFSFDSGDWMSPYDIAPMVERFENEFQLITERNGSMLLIQQETIRTSALELTRHILQRISEAKWEGMYSCS